LTPYPDAHELHLATVLQLQIRPSPEVVYLISLPRIFSVRY
jgi:hypothetical protein